jgi:ribonuclease P/MRP protein subunit POP5
MVRIKHRYLLIHVLYPEEQDLPSHLNHHKKITLAASSSTQNKTNDPGHLPWTVQFRRPSADAFNAKLLAKLIRQGVEELFGDYGAGMIAASFQGEFCVLSFFSFSFRSGSSLAVGVFKGLFGAAVEGRRRKRRKREREREKGPSPSLAKSKQRRK